MILQEGAVGLRRLGERKEAKRLAAIVRRKEEDVVGGKKEKHGEAGLPNSDASRRWRRQCTRGQENRRQYEEGAHALDRERKRLLSGSGRQSLATKSTVAGS